MALRTSCCLCSQLNSIHALPQSLWRGKCARRELRRRRAEAREAGKLLQDKQALEVKLREIQNVLETVQGQRNELRQQYRVRGWVASDWGVGRCGQVAWLASGSPEYLSPVLPLFCLLPGRLPLTLPASPHLPSAAGGEDAARGGRSQGGRAAALHGCQAGCCRCSRHSCSGSRGGAAAGSGGGAGGSAAAGGGERGELCSSAAAAGDGDEGAAGQDGGPGAAARRGGGAGLDSALLGVVSACSRQHDIATQSACRPALTHARWPALHPPAHLQSKAQAEKADLMNRLNNAVAQRNAAREEALMLEAKLKQLQVCGENLDDSGLGAWQAWCAVGQVHLCCFPSAPTTAPASAPVQDDMQSGRLAPVAAGGVAGATAAAAAVASSAGLVTPPPAAAPAAGDEGMMDRMRRFMQQIPGTSPMGTPLATPSGGWQAEGVVGVPLVCCHMCA